MSSLRTSYVYSDISATPKSILSDGIKIGTVGKIRDDMSPEGFVQYLKLPPQVAYVDEALHPEILMLPSVGNELPTLLWTLAYNPKPFQLS